MIHHIANLSRSALKALCEMTANSALIIRSEGQIKLFDVLRIASSFHTANYQCIELTLTNVSCNNVIRHTTRIKVLQRYYVPAICQSTIKKTNPSETEVDIAVYSMKKSIIGTLCHTVLCADPENNTITALLVKSHGASGNRIWLQEQRLMRVATVYLKYY